MRKHSIIMGLLLLCIIATVSAQQITCNSCENCTNKLNGDYDIVVLSDDISTSGSCIGIVSVSNVIFDCDNHSISNTMEDYTGILVSHASDVTIKNCQIYDFYSSVVVTWSDHISIINNQLSDNLDSGISISYTDSSNLLNNTIENNGNDGITLNDDLYCFNTVSGNLISGNGRAGVSSELANNDSIFDNTIYSNDYGVYILGSDNEISRNTIYDNSVYDVYISSYATGNHGYDNTCDTTYEWNDDGVSGCTYVYTQIIDLSTFLDNLTFSPAIPKTGETVNISAIIYSDSNIVVDNIKVRFYEGDRVTGEQIGDASIFGMPAQGHETASIQWTPDHAGPYNITVVIDPDNNITETDEENNQATKETTVATYRVLVVGTYYQDESFEDIKQFEPNLLASLNATTQYYLAQSYNRDFILFILTYRQMDYESWEYPDLYIFDDFYSPTIDYADEITEKVSNETSFDSIIGYQTNKQGKFRARAFPNEKFAGLNINDTDGTFAHELGHALYDFGDFYVEFPRVTRGNITNDLMATSQIEDPLTSFNKVHAGWLNYSITQSNQLEEPKTFDIIQFSDLEYGGDVEKIEGIDDPGIDISYDFILEAGEYGITIYQDHHGYLGSFIQNLESQENYPGLPTLKLYSTIYRHPVTGLQFICINGTHCIESGGPNPTVVVGYNVSGYPGMSGARLESEEVYSGQNITFYSKYLSSSLGFSIIHPTSVSVNDSGYIRFIFINSGNSSLDINSVGLSHPNGTICTIIPPSQIIVNPWEKFSVESDNCNLPYKNENSILDISVNYSKLTSNNIRPNVTYSSEGRIHLALEKSKNIPLGVQLIILLILIEVVSTILLIIYRKNKKVKKSILIMVLCVFLLLLFLILSWMYPGGQFNSEGLVEMDKYILTSSLAPINITYPDIDLHAYTPSGLHVGMNYSSGVYENQIPGAIASGDLVGEQWIFVPGDVNVSFVVDSHDVGQYLDEINSSENLSLNYSLQFMQYGPNPNVSLENGSVVINDRVVFEPVNETIGPGEQETFIPPTTTTTTTTSTTTTTTLPVAIVYGHVHHNQMPISNASVTVVCNVTSGFVQGQADNGGYYSLNVSCPYSTLALVNASSDPARICLRPGLCTNFSGGAGNASGTISSAGYAVINVPI